MKKILWCFALLYGISWGAADCTKKPVIQGRLMVIPFEEPIANAPILPGYVRVWAYNRFSVHWSKEGYRDLDGGKKDKRFPSYLPYGSLTALKEQSLFVFEKNGKEFVLTCANVGTRYDNCTFEQQVKKYAVLNHFAIVSR